MTILLIIVFAFIVGSILHAVNNFRKYIKMRNLRTFPADKDQIKQNGLLDKQMRFQNEDSFTPIKDVLTNGNGKVHHGEIGIFNISFYEGYAQKALRE